VLMHPDGVAVTLDECEELAPDEGAEDGWELAAWYAAEMLPQIFRPDAPVLEVKLPPERQRELERLLADLPPDVFKASDSLGWVYQFWQAKKKDEVNKSEVKIGADELPAVTQLFTEPYMVQFLLHNTLGAWWAGKHLSAEDAESAESEEELRERLAVGPIRWEYLRFARGDFTAENAENAERKKEEKEPSASSALSAVRQEAAWRPAAGTFDGWPDTAAELKILDPCCGSGHFLVAAFEILVHFRMAEEKLGPAEACDAVLRDNIHGLEIDERCTQIAAFALALAAWTFPGSGGYRVLPEMHIACSGLAPRAKKSEWLALAGNDVRLRNGMERLYELFQDAPVLGSLIDPTTVGLSGQQQELGVARFDELRPLLAAQLKDEALIRNVDRYELGISARGITEAARLLSTKYSLVVTNVPYLARGKQVPRLAAFCSRHYDVAKNDLATVFLERVLKLGSSSGISAIVLPQNWLFLASYKALRERLLTLRTWHTVAQLGEGGFDSPQAAGAFTAMMILGADRPRAGAVFAGLDVTQPREPSEKARLLMAAPVTQLVQDDQCRNPDARIVLAGFDASSTLLSEYASSFLGLGTGDFPRFGRFWWEVDYREECWEWLQSAALTRDPFGGRREVIYWDSEIARVRGMSSAHRERIHNQDQSGQQAWGRPGVAVALMRELRAARYSGNVFGKSMAAIMPNDPRYLTAIWCFCTSQEFHQEVRRLDQNIIVANGTLVKVPFDLEKWQQVATQRYPNGLPRPHSEDPTQWIFHGHPADTTEPLQVAVARLLGYRWPAELDEEMDLSDEARAWVARTRDVDDLVDDDGIVCLPAVRGEQPAATRLQRILARAFGDDWSVHKQTELLAAVGCKGWTLERWLQDRFFAQHCKVFQNRPFIWHIWDGLKKGGFSALVNYHKLDRKLLETLTYNYLGDWIRRQQDGVKRGEDGAADRLAAAKGLQGKLKLILKGEPPCDIFVRWKPIEEQPMGWDPDINDGVRVNIRPFMLVGDVGKKGAGVLRDKPNIKWGKDRGKDPPDAPWYHLFKGDRINDHHLTLAEKQAARDAAGGSS